MRKMCSESKKWRKRFRLESTGIITQKYEKSKDELGEEILAQKGIATHFKDFLKEQNIAWSKADERA